MDNQFASMPRLWIYALLLCSLFPLTGCTNLSNRFFRPAPQLQLDLNTVLPTDWSSIGALRNVNLDGDDDNEFLLLYSYDQVAGSGPIGALIFDLQLDSAFVTGDTSAELIPIPNQPTGFYVPYRILPNYWEVAIGISTYTSADPYAPVDQYVAPPGTLDSDIIVQPIQRTGDETGGEGSDQISAIRTNANGVLEGTIDELLIYGGSTHLTVIWWKNAFDGYGVVQLHAPNGFEDFDWGEGGTPNETPLRSVVGSFPLNDRSRLCRKVRYTRVLSPKDNGRDGSKAAITYVSTPLGIRFCDPMPTHPFYPEGVVLAYMMDPSGHANLVQASTNAPEDTAQIREMINAYLTVLQFETGEDRVETLQTRAAIPHPPRLPGGTQIPLTTNVCVEIQSLAEAAPFRQLRFILHYRPANLAARTTDQWLIVDAQQQNLALDQMTCRTFIQMRPPGS